MLARRTLSVLALALSLGAFAAPSTKRGICFNEISAADLAALSPGVSWAYNWGVGTPDAFRSPEAKGMEIGRAHVLTPVTDVSRMPSSA